MVLELEHKVDNDELEAGTFLCRALKVLEDASEESHEKVEPRFFNRFKLGGRFKLAFHFEIQVLVKVVMGLTPHQSALGKQREYAILVLPYLLGFARRVPHI